MLILWQVYQKAQALSVNALRHFSCFREVHLRSDVIVICKTIILRNSKGNIASLVIKRKIKAQSVPDV